jgi:hypothetical protein
LTFWTLAIFLLFILKSFEDGLFLHGGTRHYATVGRSLVRIPDEVDLFNLPNPSSRTMAQGLTQPLTEMSTRNLPGVKKRPARKADTLAATYEPNV